MAADASQGAAWGGQEGQGEEWGGVGAPRQTHLAAPRGTPLVLPSRGGPGRDACADGGPAAGTVWDWPVVAPESSGAESGPFRPEAGLSTPLRPEAGLSTASYLEAGPSGPMPLRGVSPSSAASSGSFLRGMVDEPEVTIDTSLEPARALSEGNQVIYLFLPCQRVI